MAIVAGVDFGTLSVRVTIVDTQRGRLGSGVSEYPLHRRKDDPDFATQSHDDHMKALADAMRKAVADAKISGDQVAALAIDTTTHKEVQSVTVGQRPWGLALSPDGRRIYTANGPSNDISVVDVASFKVVATVAVGERPWGVAVIP